MNAEEGSENLNLKQNLDATSQELYSANLQLKRLTANAAHLEGENGDMRNELEEKEAEIVHLTELCKIKAEQILSLQRNLTVSAEEKEEAQKEVEGFKIELQRLMENEKESPSSCFTSMSTSFTDERIAAFQEQLANLENEKVTMQAKLSEAVAELQKNMDCNAELRQESCELKEEVECIQYQLSTQCQINERIRQELQELKLEEDSDSVPVATEVKGNSLFSEVEDRRIIVETRMVQLQDHVRNVEDNLTKEMKENARLKARVRQLRLQANKTHNEELVNNTLQQLAESKKKVVELTEKLQKMEKLPQKESRKSSTFKMPEYASAADKRFCGYLEGLLAQSKQEMEDEKLLHEQTKLQLVHCDLHLTQKNNQLIAMTIDRDRLKARNFDLSTMLRDMQQKYEPERDETQPRGGSTKQRDSSGSEARPTKNSSQAGSPLRLCDKSNKENNDHMTSRISESFHPSKAKSVGLRETVDVISGDGNHTVEELQAKDGSGAKLARKGHGTGKYKSISYAPDLPDAEVAECAQQ